MSIRYWRFHVDAFLGRCRNSMQGQYGAIASAEWPRAILRIRSTPLRTEAECARDANRLTRSSVTGSQAALQAAQKEKRNAFRGRGGHHSEDLASSPTTASLMNATRARLQIDRGRWPIPITCRYAAWARNSSPDRQRPNAGSYGIEGLRGLREFAVDVLPAKYSRRLI